MNGTSPDGNPARLRRKLGLAPYGHAAIARILTAYAETRPSPRAPSMGKSSRRTKEAGFSSTPNGRILEPPKRDSCFAAERPGGR
jgi:hypothetical protein